MKTRRVKLFASLAVGGGMLAIVVALSRPPRPVTAFRFLDGHEPTRRIRDERSTFRYSLSDGDFNDLCAEAVAELATLGFYEPPAGSRGRQAAPTVYPRLRMFVLAELTESVCVVIRERGCGVLVSVDKTRHPLSLGNWRRYVLWRIRNRKLLENLRTRPEAGNEARRH
jgi:hypothetical protein